jgi:hypothetical protein
MALAGTVLATMTIGVVTPALAASAFAAPHAAWQPAPQAVQPPVPPPAPPRARTIAVFPGTSPRTEPEDIGFDPDGTPCAIEAQFGPATAAQCIQLPERTLFDRLFGSEPEPGIISQPAIVGQDPFSEVPFE